MFTWSFAEAMVWPIIADALLVAMVVGSRRVLPLLLSAIGGMAIGGSVWYLIAATAPEFALAVVHAAPLVNDDQFEAAHARLVSDGARAFLGQPWSGIPFKVWAAAAGALAIDPLAAIPVFIAARTARLAVSAAVAYAMSRIAGARLRKHFLPIAVAYIALFAYAWSRLQGAS